jgi:hypothetical protein
MDKIKYVRVLGKYDSAVYFVNGKSTIYIDIHP